MRPVLVDLTGSLVIMAMVFVAGRLLLSPLARLELWTFLFVVSAIGSLAHLFSTNIIWSTYHLMWVLAGVTAAIHRWRVYGLGRLRPDSNRGPSR